MNEASVSEPFRFSPTTADTSGLGGSGSVVQETRQEVQRLVREASSLVRSAASEATFWPAFIDKILRATAGEAIYVTRFQEGVPHIQVHAGEAVLQSLPEHARKCHDQLLM